MAVNPKNKAAAPASKADDVKVYKLKTPDGREYVTSDLAEASILNRAHGYRLVTPETLEEDVEGPEEAPAGNAPADA